MKTFHFTADFVFEAENIDDALAKLAAHFSARVEGEDSDLDQLGEMRLEPVSKT